MFNSSSSNYHQYNTERLQKKKSRRKYQNPSEEDKETKGHVYCFKKQILPF